MRINRKIQNTVAAAATSAALAGGALFASAAPAQADPGTDYGIYYGPLICSVLDQYPNVGGFYSAAYAIQSATGFSSYQAGQAIGTAVTYYCPRHAGWIVDLARQQGRTSLR